MAGQPGPRTRGNAPQRTPQQNIVTLSTVSTYSAAFGRRCSIELSRLQAQLSQHLKDDVLRVASGHLFCDLELEGNRKSIFTHRCILETRAAKLYSQLCSGKLQETRDGTWRVRLPSGVCEDLVDDFVRNIYWLEDPSEGETRVLAYLQQFFISSPDSEAYETPQCSPGDAKDYGFCEESCDELRASLGRSSAHYYSLVPLDDICSVEPSRPSDLLEQELEEQDELIRSFQLIKDNSLIKKPTYLQLSSRQTKNNFLYKSKAQQEAFLILEEEPNQELQTCESEEQEDILLSCISSPCSLVTPDMDPSSRTQDSGVDCGVGTEDPTMSISHPSFSSPLLPRDHTTSDTSGLSTLDDGKHNCTTMASISDAESDHEFPDEPADTNLEKSSVHSEEIISGKEKVDITAKNIEKNDSNASIQETDVSLDVQPKKMETRRQSQKISKDSELKVVETLIENVSISCFVENKADKVKEENRSNDKLQKKTEFPEKKLIESKNIESPVKSLIQDPQLELGSEKYEHLTLTACLEPDNKEADMPFCLVTSIEQEFSTGDVVLHSNQGDMHITPTPQFATYDVNRSSNKNSGNFFIDASSLLDDSEISSGDWLNSKEDKISIAGVTTSSTEDHEVIDSEDIAASALEFLEKDSDKIFQLANNVSGADNRIDTEISKSKAQSVEAVSQKTKVPIQAVEELSVIPHVQYVKELETTLPLKEEVKILSSFAMPQSTHSTNKIEIREIIKNPAQTKTKESTIIVCNDDLEKIESSMETLNIKSLEGNKILKLETPDANLQPTCLPCENKPVSVLETSLGDSAKELLPFCLNKPKLETSVVAPKPPISIPPELDTFATVDMIKSAPAAFNLKPCDNRPKSLDCSQLAENINPKHPAILVRRNTFELEADDQQIEFIRQEYEKKQGQLLFNSCIPAFSQHVTGSEGQISGNKLPMTPPTNMPSVEDCCYPSMDYQESNILQQYPHLVPPGEDDVHSPDSLNNDGPLETFCQENITLNVLEQMHNETKPMEIHKKQKYDESMPILSGGVSTADFHIGVKDSPQTRRRTESTPILSGANMASMETPTSSPRLPRKLDATAWVVDMSDPSDPKSPEIRKKLQSVLPTQLETVKICEKEPDIVKRKNSGLGFFVDLSETESQKKVVVPAPSEQEQTAEQIEKKKSFFSMYIDIGDSKPRGEIPKKIERRVFSRETSKEDKPTEQKKTAQVLPDDPKPEIPKEKQGFFMFIENEPPVMRRHTASGNKPNINRHSWNSEPKPNLEESKKHKRAQSLSSDKSFRSEELQKSASLTKIKIQSTQSLSEDSVIPTSEIEKKTKVEYTERSEIKVMTRSMDETSLTEVKIRTGRGELEPVMESSEARKQFVRLSDLDGRGVTKNEARQPGDGRARTRKVEETSWIESKLMVRGTRGLVRSKSPGSVNSTSLLSCHSPTQDTDESELSSMQSSVDRSGLDASTEETDLSSSFPGRGGPCSRLGEDLLRMFLEEINTDVTVEVAGRRIRAHKCILSSRCQYFAAMLSGGWVESAGNVISLQGFSFHAVHFALSHIYSGTNNIPDSLSIVELATLTDMLGLEGLKEVIMYTLKVKYCHFFHKPCSVCAVGVLECLPLAAAYGLDEIYHKSLRWITKYFVRIWPSKAFAGLPRELVDKCYLQHVVHMSVDSVLDTVMSCDRLLATLPSVRWAEAVFSLTSQLLDACVAFMADHFSGVLTSDRFVSLGKELSWNISRLEDSIIAAVDCLPAEQACQSHTKLSRILAVATAPEPPPEMQWSASFVELLERIKVRVEVGLVRMGARAMRCKSWAMLGANMRTKVQEAACLGPDQEEGRRARSLSLTKRGKRSRGSSSSSNSYGTTPRYSGGRLIGAAPPSFDIRQVTLAMSRGERSQPVAAVQPMPHRRGPEGCTNPERTAAKPRQARPRTATESKQMTSSGETSSSAAARPKTWPMKVLEQNKARVNQKPNSGNSSATVSRTATPEKSAVPARMKASSSESSRTSSPASRDKPKKGPAPRRPIEPMKSASSSHIPIANSKPFLSPVLRGSRETHDSPASKSVSELTRTKNSPIPALKSRIMSRSSQSSLTERRLSSGSIKLTKSSVVSSPAKVVNNNSSHQNSPLRKSTLSVSNESPKPPFRLGTSTESLRKSNILTDKSKTFTTKRSLRSQENVSQSPKPDIKSSPRPRRLAEQGNFQDSKEGVNKGLRKSLASRPPIPLSQSSSAPAINKGFKPKLLSATSRSGTFLKDEPTVLKKPAI